VKVPQAEKVLTALAGEHYAVAELCRRGYVASLTLKNYPKVEVFAFDPTTEQTVAIQVKTARRMPNEKQIGFYLPSEETSYCSFAAVCMP
jgi:hypothetical protein